MSNLSNAPEGYPTEQSGYPLMYPKDKDGKVVGNPRLIYDSQTFADVREINKYKQAVMVRESNLMQWQAEVDVKGKGFPEWTEDKVNEVLKAYDDAMNQGREDLAFFSFTQDEEYALRNRGWTRQQTAEKINQFYSGPDPEGWEGSLQKQYRSR